MFGHSRFRSVLAMLLAFSLVSASLWSYGAEAAMPNSIWSGQNPTTNPSHPSPQQVSALIPCGWGWSRPARTRIPSGRLAASFKPESFPLT